MEACNWAKGLPVRKSCNEAMTGGKSGIFCPELGVIDKFQRQNGRPAFDRRKLLEVLLPIYSGGTTVLIACS